MALDIRAGNHRMTTGSDLERSPSKPIGTHVKRSHDWVISVDFSGYAEKVENVVCARAHGRKEPFTALSQRKSEKTNPVLAFART